MKKTLIILMLLLSSRMFCQEFEWPKDYKYWVAEPDTVLVLDMKDIKIDSTMSLFRYEIADSIVSYVTYFRGDTIKIMLMVSDDLSDYTEEELSWYAPGVYIERGYAVDNGCGYTLLNKSKREYEKTIIWDWRFYDWR